MSDHGLDARLGEVSGRTRATLERLQRDVPLTIYHYTSGTGLRFIIELEKGKPTCQLEKTLAVLNTLGIKIDLIPPRTRTER